MQKQRALQEEMQRQQEARERAEQERQQKELGLQHFNEALDRKVRCCMHCTALHCTALHAMSVVNSLAPCSFTSQHDQRAKAKRVQGVQDQLRVEKAVLRRELVNSNQRSLEEEMREKERLAAEEAQRL